MTLPVSVIMPAKNSERFIRSAILSVLREEVYELFVVDDHSEDGTRAIVEEFTHEYSVHVYLLVLTHASGVSSARNLALKFATQNWVAFLDADDEWMPGKTKKELEALKRSRNPMHAYTSSKVDHYLAAGFERPLVLPEQRLGIIDLNYPSNLLCHRNVFSIVGGFDPELHVSEDIDWYNRANKLGMERVHVGEVLVRKRVHDQNTSLQGDASAHQKKILDILSRRVSEKMFPVVQ